MLQVNDLIERVVQGEDAFDVIFSVHEKKKPTIKIPAKYVKPQGEYDTKEKAARAIAAYIAREKYGDAEMNKRAAAGLRKKVGKGKEKK